MTKEYVDIADQRINGPLRTSKNYQKFRARSGILNLTPLGLLSRLFPLASRTPHGSLSSENTISSRAVQAPKNSLYP
jgi:hypothetical protein